MKKTDVQTKEGTTYTKILLTFSSFMCNWVTFSILLIGYGERTMY